MSRKKKRWSSGGASGGQSSKEDPFSKTLNPPFEELWSKERVQEGLKKGTLFQGSLTISHNNYEYAFVSNPSGGPDFSLTSFQARNRALQDDVVVVEPLEYVDPAPSGTSVQQQQPPDISSLTLQDESPVVGSEATPTPKDTPIAARADPETLVDRLYSRRKTTKPKGSTERRRTAKVVYITEKFHNRAVAGTVKAFSKGKGLAILASRDHRVPRTLIPLKDLPEDLSIDFKKYASATFVCHIKDWALTSPFPTGELMRSLGEAGLVEKEMTTILLDQQIDDKEFSAEVEACLPKTKPWTIPEEELKKRRDFRGECVLSVDPETARDLDDALHIKQVSADEFEVGVHIADVSYFMQPGTALDLEASKRATSTYLVHRVIPMLPRMLCEDLCSLNPNEDKLSFSVVWRLNGKGEYKSQWIGRSIIRSRCKLSYGDAQKMIDGEWSEENLPPIAAGTPVKMVVDSIVRLNKFAMDLCQQRRNKGTLRLNQPKLHFLLNKETGMPMGCEVYPIRQSNKMIEEFMLLANMTVARHLLEHFPQGAMLRRHPHPKTTDITDLVSRCEKLGIKLDVSTANTIQHCLDEYKHKDRDNSTREEWEKQILITMIVKTMEFALYFSSEVPAGVDPHHYALNVPLYTHFTSPIRRYADVVVHRQLADALKEGPAFTASAEEVSEQAVICNKKKKAAKLVGDSSIDLFFSILLLETGPQRYDAMVMTVRDRSFDVVLKELGIVRRVLLEKQHDSLVDFKFDSGPDTPPTLKLSWGEKTELTKKVHKTEVIRVFSELSVTVSASEKNMFQNKVDLIPPPMV